MNRKRLLIAAFILISCPSIKTWAQSGTDAHSLLKNVSDRLMSLSSLRYHYTREMNYFADNHFSKAEAECYFEFSGNIMSRFQLATAAGTQIYNGNDYFSLNHTGKTYELVKRPEQRYFSAFSYLYNSLPAMRSALNDILQDDAVAKTAGDTAIDGKAYRVLTLSMQNRSIDYLGSITHFTRPVILFYTLIIDPIRSLPIQVIQKNNLSPKDFTRVSYTQITTQSEQPSASSWLLASYNGYTAKDREKGIPLVTEGSVISAWQLPEFDGKRKNQLFKSSRLDNKLVLLDFWIKNCGYCMESFAHLKDLQERYGRQVEIISINAMDPVTDVDFFYKREKPGYRMLYEGRELAKRLGIEDRGYPTVVITGKNGKVVYAGDFKMGEIEGVIGKNL